MNEREMLLMTDVEEEILFHFSWLCCRVDISLLFYSHVDVQPFKLIAFSRFFNIKLE